MINANHDVDINLLISITTSVVCIIRVAPNAIGLFTDDPIVENIINSFINMYLISANILLKFDFWGIKMCILTLC